VLRAARAAIGTWRQHVHAMNMLRIGKLAPSKATQMWVAMWPRGQHEINMYRVAARVAHLVSESGCPASATQGALGGGADVHGPETLMPIRPITSAASRVVVPR
jgi:hypothetical protein